VHPPSRHHAGVPFGTLPGRTWLYGPGFSMSGLPGIVIARQGLSTMRYETGRLRNVAPDRSRRAGSGSGIEPARMVR